MSIGFPWDELGLKEPGDRRAIKRAYAARLKSCRPEDDAEGFARLRRAYEVALAWASDAPPVVPPIQFPDPPPPAATAGRHVEPAAEEQAEDEDYPPDDIPDYCEPVDIAALADAVLAAPAADLARILAEDETLWNLTIKDRLSVVLAARVTDDPATASPAALLDLMKFFHWDDVMTVRMLVAHGVPPDRLQHLLQAAQVRLAVEAGAADEPPLARKLLRWGAGPRAWLHALWWQNPEKAQACLSRYPGPVARLVFGDRTVDLWQRLSHGWRALGLHLLRINLVMLGLVASVRFPIYPQSSVRMFLESFWNTARIANLIALGLFGIGVVRVWNSGEAHEPVLADWSRRARLTALAVLGAALIGLSFFHGGSVRTAFSLALFGLVVTSALFVLPAMVFGMVALAGIGMVSRWLSGNPAMAEVLSRNIDFSQPSLTLFLAILIMMAAHVTLREAMIGLRLPPMRVPAGFGAAALLLVVWLNLMLL